MMKEKQMKDAYYFPHDSNAKDDPKCLMLIEQLGCEGYGIYWILIEVLRDQPDYCYPVNLLPALARRFNTTAEKIKAVVGCYDLFTIRDETVFFSESLVRRMNYVEEKRKKLSDAGKRGNEKRWKESDQKTKKIATQSPPDNHANATQSQVKESKGKEIINNQRLLCDNKLSPVSDSFKNNSEIKTKTEDLECKPDYALVVELYHENCKAFPKVFKLSDSRKTKIRIRLEEMKNDYSILETIFKKMGESKFLQGDNKTGWKASFDWLFENEKNWVKVIEGNYESNQAPGYTASSKSKTAEHTKSGSTIPDLDALYRESLTVNK